MAGAGVPVSAAFAVDEAANLDGIGAGPSGRVAAVGCADVPIFAWNLWTALARAGLASVAGCAGIAVLAGGVLDDGPPVRVGAWPTPFAGPRITRAAGLHTAATNQAARDELADAASLVRVAGVGGAVQPVIAVSLNAVGAESVIADGRTVGQAVFRVLGAVAAAVAAGCAAVLEAGAGRLTTGAEAVSTDIAFSAERAGIGAAIAVFDAGGVAATRQVQAARPALARFARIEVIGAVLVAIARVLTLGAKAIATF